MSVRGKAKATPTPPRGNLQIKFRSACIHKIGEAKRLLNAKFIIPHHIVHSAFALLPYPTKWTGKICSALQTCQVFYLGEIFLFEL
ncbi:MAG: hypothetical protein RIR73_1853 [Chloroflexota bacterium]